ncbi:CBS domain-containing protein [Saccharolobus islandicus]|uniref:Putative signal-transduction protein with CBS domains n=4 Tax=Saccharolobus islandicus TaxID=43080 RepID=F0NC16_SACI5|nr:CBS domain-containing protein [Sulfolobus islandicus]ACP38875.1 putative signal-transduction protein with CBS domains [Sulfolobus islandicus M.14.25]ACP56079.1 putative signal-transduction protein with CBS domains [Sulfolobus islandicus M.16.27]ACR42743.1 putative signal-transduction protein with CBS domains [Sulfolobus islandicus M.16.4]ADX86072.1 putative signal-transduction protein with CBS domains [Sulfolobus islandicus REY15A]
MKEEFVREYMKSNVVTVSKNTVLREVTRIMTDNNVGSVIVVDNGKPIGIITERDVVRAIGKGRSLDVKAEEIMTASLITIKEDSPITGALSLMRTYNIRHLPVIDHDGNLRGIISIRDIARAIDDILEG